MICGRLYKTKSDSVSAPSMHLPCLREHAGKLQCGQNTLQQLCISCRTPSLCRNSRPDTHSIGLHPSPVPKAFRREGQAEYPTITVHLLLQWEQRWLEHLTRAWLGNVRQTPPTMPCIQSMANYEPNDAADCANCPLYWFDALVAIVALRRRHIRTRGNNALI